MVARRELVRLGRTEREGKSKKADQRRHVPSALLAARI
jgi:hypothetical protein